MYFYTLSYFIVNVLSFLDGLISATIILLTIFDRCRISKLTLCLVSLIIYYFIIYFLV